MTFTHTHTFQRRAWPWWSWWRVTGTSPLSYILLKVVGCDGRGRNTPTLGGPLTMAPLMREAGVKAATDFVELAADTNPRRPPLTLEERRRERERERERERV